jgi:hypothetical protein
MTYSQFLETKQHRVEASGRDVDRSLVHPKLFEMVLTPFGGIGSEAFMALKLKRRATLIELKPEYFGVAVKNLATVTRERDAARLV